MHLRRKICTTVALSLRPGSGRPSCVFRNANKTPQSAFLIAKDVSDVIMPCSSCIMKTLAGLPQSGGDGFAFSMYSLGSNRTSMKY